MNYNHLILLDRSGECLEFFLTQTQVTITVLVCEQQPKCQELIAKFPERILHILDYEQLLDVQHIQNIDYDLIAQMKHIQIDIETMLHRIMYNNPLAKDIYHQHLSFFLEIFKTHKIDLVFCAEAILATPNHLIPFGLAELFHIPAYNLDGYFYGTYALHNYNQKCCVAFHEDQKPQVNIQEIMFYKPKLVRDQQHFSMRKLIKKYLSKLGGEMLCEFFVCLYKRSFTRNRLGIPYSYFDKLASFRKFKAMHHYYCKHSKMVDFHTPYIYYSIHMEPEAAIIGRTTLEAQLTIIKMLASALPQGWKLYVKEHPHQFMLNNEISSYFINHIEFFKNQSFYEEIQKIPNVSMVSLQVSSKELLENAKAISTMGGTITLESFASKKPAILFNAQSSVYGKLSNVLSVQTYQDLKVAIQHIQTGFDIHLSEGFEHLQKFLSTTQDENFYHNLLLSMQNHSQELKKNT